MDLPLASGTVPVATSATRLTDRTSGSLLPGGSDSAALALALRLATRELHHAVDHHPLLAPLVRDGLTRHHYGQVVRALLWLYQPLQESLADGLARSDRDYPLADRVAWLLADLATLGIPANLPADAWTPPVPANPRELAGMLYVVEGSTLGGQIIARQLAASLGVGATTGAVFFNGWGGETIERWQAFWVHANFLTGGNTEEACAAAAGLFQALLQGLDRARIWTAAQCS